jgi:hypothetical protein
MVSEINPFPLDPVTFRDWLREQQQAGASVGLSCDDEACPLSRFLSFLYGGSWVVDVSTYERLDDDLLHPIAACFPLPAWAERFAAFVDGAANNAIRSVSAAEALVHLTWACGISDLFLEGENND